MNIILIRPPFPKENMALSAQPLGIAYLASFLREKINNLNIKLLDAHIEDLSQTDILRYISDFKPDLVGISYLTVQADFSFSLSAQIKKLFPKVIIIHGGVHVTCSLDETMDYADYSVVGEGEVTLFQLIKAIREEENCEAINGICFRKGSEVIKTPPRDFISDINTLPFPAWDLLPMEKYRRHSIHVKKGEAIGIMASRGCPFNCSFCASPMFWQQKVRFRSPKNIVSEIEEIISHYGIVNFHFYDDNLLLNSEFVINLCEEILKQDLYISWACLGRISLIKRNPQILKLMRQAGCVAIELGIESFDDAILEKIGKKEKTGDIPEVFKLIKENGISPLMLLMTFNAGETISGWYLQAKGLRQLEPQASIFLGQFATPYPGTDFDNNCSKLGVKLVKRWQDYSTSNINFIPFSLLRDIPINTNRYFGPEYLLRIVLSSLQHRGLWNSNSISKKIENALIWANLTLSLYQRCCGELSIEDIAKKMASEYNIDFNLSLKASAFISVLLAQLGLIKSEGSNAPVSPYKSIFSKFGLFSKFGIILFSFLLFSFSVIFKNILRRNQRNISILIAEAFGA
ncbi:MAG: radical SAM protein [Candidatus Omnitrophota bacterium]